MEENTDISKLLRLKRYEQPPDGYFDDFLHEFHRRQRASLMRQPFYATVWERLLSIAPSFRVPQFAYAAMAAIAVSASVLIVSPRSGDTTAVASANKTAIPAMSITSTPVTIGDTQTVATGGLPTHYVLQARPVSNERPLSF